MRRFYTSLLLLLTVVSAIAVDSTKPRPLGVIATRSGRIAGGRTAEGQVAYYKGIPFAAPPVGELRWKEPQPVTPWTGVRACREYGPSPMQATPAPFSMWSAEFLIPKAPISEDCLYLNVWTSAPTATARQPVLVWIYGGGFMSGGSAVPIYDGAALAKRGVVVVSINYRVGPFGFLAHPELTKESPHGASGNYGLLDQLAALRWVQENIALFGGDPARVTIAGQSAGAMSVSCLVASPLAKGLFHQAIAESGAAIGRAYPPLAQAEQAGERYGRELQAPSLAALRQVPAEALLQHLPALKGPILDGYVLPASPRELLQQGKSNPISLLTGWNEDEGLLDGPLLPAEGFRQRVRQQYGQRADSLLHFYPTESEQSAANAQLQLARDLRFGLPTYTWVTLQDQHLRRPAYLYRFTRKVPATGEYRKYGAFHTGEVPYVFNTLGVVSRPWEKGDYQLAETIAGYWVNFVRTGNPNGSGLPNWPAFHARYKQTLLLDLTPAARPLPDQVRLNFLQTLPVQP
ncbi:carboxylesterase/lipase family protein [Hymenobacter wooponensis]|uniref:Carboxylic ester hydrolase n=1 Tax=Hymenobacter wooponensis TaxID=1525360 RepID=A0A4Z0MNL7_9BACT|nr:carboxylesterase family protein [Hymenobacter wooponensis]TGD80857.1 carboxylesterase family protein [Hymenobacter wooponensis]